MAVYTRLDSHTVQPLVSSLGLGQLSALQGIAGGVENSSYLVIVRPPEISAPAAKYVLTVVEDPPAHGVVFIAEWMRRLAAIGLPVAAPLADPFGCAVHQLAGKPVLLVPFARGRHPTAPTTVQCAAVGRWLGAAHTLALASELHQPSSRDLAWVATTAEAVLPALKPAERADLRRELRWLRENAPLVAELPRAMIHGDLFRDNALFDDGELTAVIDFFMAGEGPLLLDLAIAANDWCCCDEETSLEADRHIALLRGYVAERCPLATEVAYWPHALRLAALRFWISRLGDRHLATAAQRHGTGKDPAHMRTLLEDRRREPPAWPLPP